MQDKLFYFYVLYCQDGTLYAGYTTDLDKRLACHNQGKGAKYTRVLSRRPVRMIYAEIWTSRSQAMSAEAKFKLLNRQSKERYLAENGQPRLTSSKPVIVSKLNQNVSTEGDD